MGAAANVANPPRDARMEGASSAFHPEEFEKAEVILRAGMTYKDRN
jgi:hypothetical protein